MDFVSENNKPLSKVEVIVMAVDDNFVILEIKSIEFAHEARSLLEISHPSGRLQEKIFWPRNKIEQAIQVGDTLILELKPHQTTSIKNLVENAKKQQDFQNFATMKKLLETLIN